MNEHITCKPGFWFGALLGLALVASAAPGRARAAALPDAVQITLPNGLKLQLTDDQLKETHAAAAAADPGAALTATLSFRGAPDDFKPAMGAYAALLVPGQAPGIAVAVLRSIRGGTAQLVVAKGIAAVPGVSRPPLLAALRAAKLSDSLIRSVERTGTGTSKENLVLDLSAGRSRKLVILDLQATGKP